MLRGNRLPLIAAVIAAVVIAASFLGFFEREGPLPSFEAQACALDPEELLFTQRGYFEPRSGQIAILPDTPAYMASGGGGWSHSGPWPYLVDVPLVFYGPGLVAPRGEIAGDATLADVAPTYMTFLRASIQGDGESLDEVARFSGKFLRQDPPRLIVTVVWDGGGDNVLEHFPDAWPNLESLMREGVSYEDATVGSSPSVTPAVHTTLGTGVFPWIHGITGVPMRDEKGEVVDAFLKGESSHFIQVPTIAERWDEQTNGRALVGMLGYEPWHLGMIGQGAERTGGDKDDAIWLNVENNEWITNPDHYNLPSSVEKPEWLDEEVSRLDAEDGEADGRWLGHDILGKADRIEETPAFIRYHGRVMQNMIREEGYGDDRVTDLLFTNFKQIDRLGHYFNMDSPEVRDALVESDKVLGELVSFLDDEVGQGKWLLTVTADHGQQPDAGDIDGYGIDPREVKADLEDEFGPIVRAVWPTEVFLLEDAMEERGVTVEEVARWLGDYRLADNTQRPDFLLGGQGSFHAQDRLFALSIPSRLLPDLEC